MTRVVTDPLEVARLLLHSQRHADDGDRLLPYETRGGGGELWSCTDTVVCIEGPAGTGKTLGALMKADTMLRVYDGARWLILRKTFASLKSSTLATYRDEVLIDFDGREDLTGVRLWGERADDPVHYAYPNGSKLVIGGLDNPGKILSSSYDGILIDQAEELTETDLEVLMTRIERPRIRTTQPYSQIILCANPGPQTHWLLARMQRGSVRRITSRHVDNPALYDAEGQITAAGKRYMAVLDQLTGVRRERLLLGRWVAAEGMVYDQWDPRIHVVKRFPLADESPRYLAVDFGLVDPFVCLWFAVQDEQLICYRELYMTGQLVEDHARHIVQLSRWGEPGGEPVPRAIVCDHAAEERMALQRHLVRATIPAYKGIGPGIQAVTARLRVREDGRPRLIFFDDCLVERDPTLEARKVPASVLEEFDSYSWDTRENRRRGELPVDKFNHGMDSVRYAVTYLDAWAREAQLGPRIW